MSTPTIIVARPSGLQDRFVPMGRRYGRALDISPDRPGLVRDVVASRQVAEVVATAQREGRSVRYVQ